MKKILTILTTVLLITGLFFSCKKENKEDNSLEELKARGKFVLGLDDAFPPLGFRDDDNNIVGYDIDLAKEVANRLGVQFVAQPINWDSKEQELSTGNIDCIWNGLTITPERKEQLSFSKPYLNNAQVLVVKNDSGIKTLADLKGKVIGLQAGSSAQDAVSANPEFESSLKQIVPFEQNLLALTDLSVGGLDAVVMDVVAAEYSIRVSNYPLHTLKESLASEEYGIAFRKNEVKLTNEVQRILEEMAQDGTVAAISEKWFGTDISVIGK